MKILTCCDNLLLRRSIKLQTGVFNGVFISAGLFLPRRRTGIFLFLLFSPRSTQDKQPWNTLCTQWNLDAPKFVPKNRQKCPICAKCVKGVLGKHISTAHPVSRANFVCTVIGCEQTFFTKKMHERAIWQRTTESRSPSHLGVTNQGASLVHLKQTGTSWIT